MNRVARIASHVRDGVAQVSPLGNLEMKLEVDGSGKMKWT